MARAAKPIPHEIQYSLPEELAASTPLACRVLWYPDLPGYHSLVRSALSKLIFESNFVKDEFSDYREEVVQAFTAMWLKMNEEECPMIGQIIMTVRTLPEPQWLECVGQVINRVDYPELSAVWPSATVGTMTLPNFIDRYPYGANPQAGDEGSNVLTQSGANTHTLSINEMPSHNHIARGLSVPLAAPGEYVAIEARTGPFNYFTSSTGGSAPHNNRPAGIAVRMFMRVKP